MNQELSQILIESGFQENIDFAIDPHKQRLILLTETAQDRVQEMLPMLTFSAVLAQGSADGGWHCVASLGGVQDLDNAEMADPTIEAKMRGDDFLS